MSGFSANDLIFNSDDNLGIYTGGFSVNSIMMKSGISPIMTINNGQHGGSKVSDLFNADLVVPNWAYTYGGDIGGRSHNMIDSDDDVDEIDDDLHNKLVDLIKVHENELKNKHKKTRNNKNKYKNKKTAQTKKNK